ncbi:hypothetical protein [uncultured Roseibium sp.]|uniref:hypothetical protein n=1 Tax=uncultured Roseibium sp. TaxID=1936171 RepID=UPI00260A5A00|nr:hypothetical protein [uncultured Roseibium sp.]
MGSKRSFKEGRLTTNASHLKDIGRIHLVDFGPQKGLPAWFRTPFFAWPRLMPDQLFLCGF